MTSLFNSPVSLDHSMTSLVNSEASLDISTHIRDVSMRAPGDSMPSTAISMAILPDSKPIQEYQKPMPAPSAAIKPFKSNDSYGKRHQYSLRTGHPPWQWHYDQRQIAEKKKRPLAGKRRFDSC